MRILHVVPWYMPAWRYGGPIKIVHGLCKALVRRGHEIHVFTTNADGCAQLDVPTGIPVDIDGVRVWYFATNQLKRLYWSTDMASALTKHVPGFDLLHLHSVYTWPTTVAAAIARRQRVPYLLTPYGMLMRTMINGKNPLVKQLWIAMFERRNLENASCVHFISTEEAHQSATVFYSTKTAIVGCGLDGDEYDAHCETTPQAATGLSENCRFLLFLGRVSWEKGLDRLITALALVPACTLVVAGYAERQYQAELERLAVETGVRERVVFLGPAHGPRKAALLRHALALILPSYSESFGMVVLEALAVGCPVILTPEVGAADIVRKLGGGVIFSGDPDKLGAGVYALLSDSATLQQMRGQAHRAVKTQYTWDAVSGELEEIYRSSLGGGAAHLDAG